MEIANIIKDITKSTLIISKSNILPSITASIGVTSFTYRGDKVNIFDIIDIADSATYSAKKMRDNVVYTQEQIPS
jgi:PleD family two-component response regulator